ncbi:unnamed protein product, partial [Ilex paraguariensis]
METTGKNKLNSSYKECESTTKSSSMKINMYSFVTPVRGTIKRRIFAGIFRSLKLACRMQTHLS